MRDLAFILLIFGVGSILHAYYSDKASKAIAERRVEVKYLPRETYYDTYFSKDQSFKSMFELSEST